MKLSRILVGAATVVALSSPVGAQQVTLNFDDLGRCTGTPLSTYGGWLAIASGVTCQTGPYSVISAQSTDNYLRSAGSMDWSFLNGPVVFNGLYASGYGSFYLDLMSGGNVVYSRNFLAYGSNLFVGPNSFGGQVDRVRIRLYQGYGVLGVDDVSFVGQSAPPPPEETPPEETPPEETPPGETPPGDDGDDDINTLLNEPNSTPEPATLLLVASGLSGLGALARRRRQSGQVDP